MMSLKKHPNPPYRGRIEESRLIESVLCKTYFVSILDRLDEQRPLHEWSFSPFSMDDVEGELEKVISQSPNLGVPFISISMPHWTRVWRWGDPRVEGERETNYYAVGISPTNRINKVRMNEGLILPDQTSPLSCPGEIYIFGQENDFRCGALNLEEYMSWFVPNGIITDVKNPNLIREHLEK